MQHEIIALQVFTALSNYPDDMGRFLNEAGTNLDLLRTTLQQPETLAAVLDYALNNENLLLQICEDTQLKPNTIWKARLELPGSPAYV